MCKKIFSLLLIMSLGSAGLMQAMNEGPKEEQTLPPSNQPAESKSSCWTKCWTKTRDFGSDVFTLLKPSGHNADAYKSNAEKDTSYLKKAYGYRQYSWITNGLYNSVVAGAVGFGIYKLVQKIRDYKKDKQAKITKGELNDPTFGEAPLIV